MNIIFDIDDTITRETEFMMKYAPKYLKNKYNLDFKIINPNGYDVADVFGVEKILKDNNYPGNIEEEVKKINSSFWNKYFLKYMFYPLKPDTKKIIDNLINKGYKINFVSLRGKKTHETENMKQKFVRKKIVPFLTKMQLKFNDNISYVRGEIGAKNIYINLKPQDLAEKKGLEEASVGESLSFDGSLLGNSELTIDKVEIGDSFKLAYNFCSKKDKCMESYEYVTPTATGNYFKTLLKITGTFEPDTIANLDGITNVYYFLNKFGVIHYKVNDTWYSHTINSELIKPRVAKETGVYYMEVNREVKNATEIYLTFKVRDYDYKYVLK